jgi:hypothetical protein
MDQRGLLERFLEHGRRHPLRISLSEADRPAHSMGMDTCPQNADGKGCMIARRLLACAPYDPARMVTTPHDADDNPDQNDTKRHYAAPSDIDRGFS